MEIDKIYKNRFSQEKSLKEKNIVWQTLCKYFFQNFIPQNSVIIDVGAGYCEFLNNIEAQKKYGFDLNSDSKDFSASDVLFYNSGIFDIEKIINEKVDIIFASHVLEHLNTKEDVLAAFKIFNNVLKNNGRIIILTPNITLLGGKYWDFIDHKVPLNDVSIIEAGEINGFKCVKKITKFLPYTTKSKLPKFKFLVWCYLKLLPISGFFFGKTSFIVLEKTNGTTDDCNTCL